MTFRVNCKVDILRGESTDEYGDPYDNSSVAYSGVMASLIEQAPDSRSRPADGRTDQVRAYTLRLLNGAVVVQRGDQVRLTSITRQLARTTPLLDVGDVLTIDMHATAANPAGHTWPRMTVRKVT